VAVTVTGQVVKVLSPVCERAKRKKQSRITAVKKHERRNAFCRSSSCRPASLTWRRVNRSMVRRQLSPFPGTRRGHNRVQPLHTLAMRPPIILFSRRIPLRLRGSTTTNYPKCHGYFLLLGTQTLLKIGGFFKTIPLHVRGRQEDHVGLCRKSLRRIRAVVFGFRIKVEF
jgi:hypothetical protein